MKKKIIVCILLILIPSVSLANALSDINLIFDWAEKQFSNYFSPAEQKTRHFSDLNYRYYSKTNSYIGEKNQDVYIYGDEFNGLQKVGNIDDFLPVIADNNNLINNTSGQNEQENNFNQPFLFVSSIPGSAGGMDVKIRSYFFDFAGSYQYSYYSTNGQLLGLMGMTVINNETVLEIATLFESITVLPETDNSLLVEHYPAAFVVTYQSEAGELWTKNIPISDNDGVISKLKAQLEYLSNDINEVQPGFYVCAELFDGKRIPDYIIEENDSSNLFITKVFRQPGRFFLTTEKDKKAILSDKILIEPGKPKFATYNNKLYLISAYFY